MTDAPSEITELCTAIISDNPKHKMFLDAAIEKLDAEEQTALADYINFCLEDGLNIAELAEGYSVILKDTLNEQLYFLRNNEYRHRSFAEVADSVYFDDNYMRNYMHGLALTAYIWPNHLDMHRYFLRCLPRAKRGRYLEIGPGHGANFLAAIRLGAFDQYLGVDISPTSIDLTRRLIERAAPERISDVNLLVEDFLTWKPKTTPFDAIVMGEVLEHVEDPGAFLARIASLSDPGTYIHMTTCINAPAIDHIYLFRHSDDVEELIYLNGLSVIGRYLGPHVGNTIEKCIKQHLPINVAYVLGKQL